MADAKPKVAKRTVSFFRLVAEDGQGKPVRFTAVPWQTVLAKIQGWPLLDRTWDSGERRLIVEVLNVDGDLAMKIMEPRDEDSWLEILRKDQAAAPVEGVGGDLVETTIVVFLPSKNLFGMIKGSTASPSHAAVAEWLDHLTVEGDKRLLKNPSHLIRAEAAMSKRQQQQLAASFGVSSASVRISTDKAAELQATGSGLGQVLESLKSTYGSLMVTVTLQIPRGKANDAARETLKTETERLRSVADDAEAVTAKLVYYDAESRSRQEAVDFLHQRITVQRSVDLRDERGESIRNASAVRSILTAAYDARVDLNSV